MKKTKLVTTAALSVGLLAGCGEAVKPKPIKDGTPQCHLAYTTERFIGSWTLGMKGTKVVATDFANLNGTVAKTVSHAQNVRASHPQYSAVHLRGIAATEAQLTSARKPESYLQGAMSDARANFAGRDQALGGTALTVDWISEAQRTDPDQIYIIDPALVPAATPDQAVITSFSLEPVIKCTPKAAGSN